MINPRIASCGKETFHDVNLINTTLVSHIFLSFVTGGSQILTPEGFLKEVKGLSNSGEDANDE